MARITSLYDADGREIALNDVSRVRVLRETEAPIREGDLLFNLFWGAPVAVAVRPSQRPSRRHSYV